jgi:hypothetical protein
MLTKEISDKRMKFGKRELRSIFKVLVFLFGLGLIIAGNTIEIKMWGLLYLVLSLN